MSGVIHVNNLKMAREALCLAEGAIRHIHGPTPRADLIAAMIRDIDEQRPLGPDGKHGNRHTPTCGCDRDLPLHRTEAGWPRCATCDGGGCPDCTDPA